MTYRVIVPRSGKTAVSYPPSGHALYTRDQAIEILRRFHSRAPLPDGDEREPYAEGPTERFTIHFPTDFTGG